MYIHSLVLEFNSVDDAERFQKFMDTQLPETDYRFDAGNGRDVFYVIVGKMMKHQLAIIVENI